LHNVGVIKIAPIVAEVVIKTEGRQCKYRGLLACPPLHFRYFIPPSKAGLRPKEFREQKDIAPYRVVHKTEPVPGATLHRNRRVVAAIPMETEGAAGTGKVVGGEPVKGHKNILEQ
jgi:hypothetical protein